MQERGPRSVAGGTNEAQCRPRPGARQRALGGQPAPAAGPTGPEETPAPRPPPWGSGRSRASPPRTHTGPKSRSGQQAQVLQPLRAASDPSGLPVPSASGGGGLHPRDPITGQGHTVKGREPSSGWSRPGTSTQPGGAAGPPTGEDSEEPSVRPLGSSTTEGTRCPHVLRRRPGAEPAPGRVPGRRSWY